MQVACAHPLNLLTCKDLGQSSLAFTIEMVLYGSSRAHLTHLTHIFMRIQPTFFCRIWKKRLRWYPQQLQRFILQIFLKGAAKPSAGNPGEPVEPVGNSLGRAPLGGSKMEATTGWTEGKLREIARGELRGKGAKWKRRQGGRRGNRGK